MSIISKEKCYCDPFSPIFLELERLSLWLCRGHPSCLVARERVSTHSHTVSNCFLIYRAGWRLVGERHAKLAAVFDSRPVGQTRSVFLCYWMLSASGWGPFLL